ncbi:protein translocase subunit [Saccharomycopsis crataegensis]|uniref:Mitochondrial import inner membrane translocase subunit TIM50 n=1 Tax=Saccharomycopsis crataegensis TaxID=43959 RepID=A0AAV5QID4_9ASCO|nr:protein translocase subunit [Saccharomycopsis crataegensis]
MSLFRASTSAARVLARTRVATPSGIVARNSTLLAKLNQSRHYAEKKSDPQPSVLSEDLLAKAGFDMDQIEENTKKIGSENKEPSANENPTDSQEGEKPRKRTRRNNKTSGDLKREKWANVFYLVLFGVTGASCTYMSRDWEEDENQHTKLGEEPIPNGYTPSLMYQRFKKRFDNIFLFFSEPTVDKLLPDAPPEIYRRPMTLVISLEDLLVHSEWDPKKGWRTAKRPGLDYFLLYLSGFYEIVLFSDNYSMYVEKTIQKLDPYNAYFSAVLTKEAAKLQDGKVIKDLSLMNRDMGKIVIMDPNPDHYSLQPENALPIKPWDGSPDDTLIKYIPFLEYCAGLGGLKDVRPILSTFNNCEKIPEEFAVREAALREKWNKDHAQGNNFAAKLLGLPTAKTASKMPLDNFRDRAQENYVRVKKYIEDNIKAEEARANAMMANQKVTLGSLAGSYLEGSNPGEVIAQRMLEAQTQAQSEGEKKA